MEGSTCWCDRYAEFGIKCEPCQVRELQAQLSAKEAERLELSGRLWREQLARIEAAAGDEASLRLALDASTHNHRKDNEYLLARAERAEQQITVMVEKLRAIEQEMREAYATTCSAPPGGQHVTPGMYQHPTTHRFAKDYLLPWAEALATLCDFSS